MLMYQYCFPISDDSDSNDGWATDDFDDSDDESEVHLSW